MTHNPHSYTEFKNGQMRQLRAFIQTLVLNHSTIEAAAKSADMPTTLLRRHVRDLDIQVAPVPTGRCQTVGASDDQSFAKGIGS
ncbi:MAG: hypothetical protein AAF429_14525 [Pseudomonadota bacterium]